MGDESENLDDGTPELLDQCVVGVLLPHIQSFRKAARIFVVDTRWAVEDNHPPWAAENIQTMLGLARQATDCNMLVGTLVGYAVAGIAFNQLEEVLIESPELLQEAQLAELQQTIENISFRDWVTLGGRTGDVPRCHSTHLYR